MRCYKVVHKVKDKRVSCFITGILEKKYSTKRFTIANKALFSKGYGLCCFKSLQTVKDFLGTFCYGPFCEIWEVEGENQTPFGQKARIRTNYDLGLKTIKSILNFLVISKHTTKKWPKGTIMFEKVKLIKKIE